MKQSDVEYIRDQHERIAMNRLSLITLDEYRNKLANAETFEDLRSILVHRADAINAIMQVAIALDFKLIDNYETSCRKEDQA